MKIRIGPILIAAAFLLAVYLCLPDSMHASESEGKWGVLLPIGRFFNLGLVVLVLVWIARKPLRTFYVSRTQIIREQLAEAQQARQEAEHKLAEMQERMGHLDEELAQIKAAAEKEAKDEYQRLLSDAERDAEKIIARARQEIEGMTRSAQIELRAHAAELSVSLAEQKIKTEITDEDRGKLFGRFVSQLGDKG